MDALTDREAAGIALGFAAAFLFLLLNYLAYRFDTKGTQIDTWSVNWHERIMDEENENGRD